MQSIYQQVVTYSGLIPHERLEARTNADPILHFSQGKFYFIFDNF